MGNRHPTCPFCHSSTAEGYICYILRAIFLMRSSARLVGIHRRFIAPRYRGVPGGRYRSVAERVLSYTAVGFVLETVELVTGSRWCEPPVYTLLRDPLCSRSISKCNGKKGNSL